MMNLMVNRHRTRFGAAAGFLMPLLLSSNAVVADGLNQRGALKPAAAPPAAATAPKPARSPRRTVPQESGFGDPKDAWHQLVYLMEGGRVAADSGHKELAARCFGEAYGIAEKLRSNERIDGTVSEGGFSSTTRSVQGFFPRLAQGYAAYQAARYSPTEAESAAKPASRTKLDARVAARLDSKWVKKVEDGTLPLELPQVWYNRAQRAFPSSFVPDSLKTNNLNSVYEATVIEAMSAIARVRGTAAIGGSYENVQKLMLDARRVADKYEKWRTARDRAGRFAYETMFCRRILGGPNINEWNRQDAESKRPNRVKSDGEQQEERLKRFVDVEVRNDLDSLFKWPHFVGVQSMPGRTAATVTGEWSGFIPALVQVVDKSTNKPLLAAPLRIPAGSFRLRVPLPTTDTPKRVNAVVRVVRYDGDAASNEPDPYLAYLQGTAGPEPPARGDISVELVADPALAPEPAPVIKTENETYSQTVPHDAKTGQLPKNFVLFSNLLDGDRIRCTTDGVMPPVEIGPGRTTFGIPELTVPVDATSLTFQVERDRAVAVDRSIKVKFQPERVASVRYRVEAGPNLNVSLLWVRTETKDEVKSLVVDGVTYTTAQLGAQHRLAPSADGFIQTDFVVPWVHEKDAAPKVQAQTADQKNALTTVEAEPVAATVASLPSDDRLPNDMGDNLTGLVRIARGADTDMRLAVEVAKAIYANARTEGPGLAAFVKFAIYTEVNAAQISKDGAKGLDGFESLAQRAGLTDTFTKLKKLVDGSRKVLMAEAARVVNGDIDSGLVAIHIRYAGLGQQPVVLVNGQKLLAEQIGADEVTGICVIPDTSLQVQIETTVSESGSDSSTTFPLVPAKALIANQATEADVLRLLPIESQKQLYMRLRGFETALPTPLPDGVEGTIARLLAARQLSKETDEARKRLQQSPITKESALASIKALGKARKWAAGSDITKLPEFLDARKKLLPEITPEASNNAVRIICPLDITVRADGKELMAEPADGKPGRVYLTMGRRITVSVNAWQDVLNRPLMLAKGGPPAVLTPQELRDNNRWPKEISLVPTDISLLRDARIQYDLTTSRSTTKTSENKNLVIQENDVEEGTAAVVAKLWRNDNPDGDPDASTSKTIEFNRPAGAALLVAIEDYSKSDLPSLEGMIGDAEALKSQLITAYDYPRSNVFTVYLRKGGKLELSENLARLFDQSNKPLPANAELSEEVIKRCFDLFSKACVSRRAKHIVVFYGGHGLTKRTEGGIVDQIVLGSGATVRFEIDLMEGVRADNNNQTTRIVSFFSACRQLASPPDSEPSVSDYGALYARFNACRPNEVANIKPESGGGSYFVDLLLTSLKGNSRLTVDQLQKSMQNLLATDKRYDKVQRTQHIPDLRKINLGLSLTMEAFLPKPQPTATASLPKSTRTVTRIARR